VTGHKKCFIGFVLLITVICSLLWLVIRDLNVRIALSDSDAHVIGVSKIDLLGLEVYTKLDLVDKKDISIVELEDDLSDYEVLTSLIDYSKNVPYIPDQPYPTNLIEVGGNCQAFSVWLSAQLDHYGIENEYYLSEGKDHMAVITLGYVVDLAYKQIFSIDSYIDL